MLLDKSPYETPTEFKALDSFFHNIDFLIPGYEKSSQYMVAIHRDFYRWAQQWVRGMTVLDAGCGEGYGVAILAESAAHAVGVDIKAELIQHARQRYPAGNAAFEVMACEALDFPAASFDVVVCNELVEHLPDHSLFMKEAHRVLKRGGLFICATTNAQIGFKNADNSPMNRNHYREFDSTGLQAELAPYYQEIRLYGQPMNSRTAAYVTHPGARRLEWLLVRLNIKHRIPIRWRNFVRERITRVKVDEMIAPGYEIVENQFDNVLYLIGTGVKL
jgi:2-polyprenyl-3-methyl-5-hydroxy-6-metoxy-1,4-benzoquinol methylase